MTFQVAALLGASAIDAIAVVGGQERGVQRACLLRRPADG